VGWIDERSENGLKRNNIAALSPGDKLLLRTAGHNFTSYTGAEAGTVSTRSR